MKKIEIDGSWYEEVNRENYGEILHLVLRKLDHIVDASKKVESEWEELVREVIAVDRNNKKTLIQLEDVCLEGQMYDYRFQRRKVKQSQPEKTNEELAIECCNAVGWGVHPDWIKIFTKVLDYIDQKIAKSKLGSQLPGKEGK